VSRYVVVAVIAFASVGAVCPTVHARTEKPSIEALEVGRDAGRVRVSYRLEECLSEEAHERIASGIPLRFKHKIEIVERRPGLFSRDRVFSRTIVETGVQYDSLTERYELTRAIELKSRRDQPEVEPIEETEQTTSEEEMLRWLTEVRGAPLLLPDRGETVEYHVRVEVSIGRKWFLLIIPTTHTVQLEAPAEIGD
jgi:hypothetical protein